MEEASLSLVRFEESPNDKGMNKGWIVHEIKAILDNEQVGYIKISYIPNVRYNQHYNTGINYKRGFGWGGLDEEVDRRVLKRLVHFCWYDHPLYYQVENMSDKEAELVYWKIERHIKKRYYRELVKFKLFHVDKPLVDYIRVNEKFQRQGIGTKLYLDAAKWMTEKGLSLHASGLQSKQAASAWQKFLQLGLAKKRGSRTVLITKGNDNV